MHTHNLLPPPRLVASGGPVTRAVLAGRGDGVEAERARLRALCSMIRERIVADAEMIHRLERRFAELSEVQA